MRRPLVAIVGLCVASSAAVAQRSTSFTPLANMLAPDAPVDEYSITADGNRVYYSTWKGEVAEVWLFDRQLGKSSRISEGGVIWDIAVAPNGSSVAFARAGEAPSRQSVIWAVPLDPRTGLAAGQQRRVSMMPGDYPSISPDGRLIAFARIDSLVGHRSLVVLPIMGGPEHALASFPVEIQSIRWTPDAKALYFSLNSRSDSSSTMGGSIYRISVSGGAPTFVVSTNENLVTTNENGPGLSPDGKLLVFRDTGFMRSYVVADTTGRRLSGFSLPRDMVIDQWIGSTVVASRNTLLSRLHAQSLADGSSRIFADSFGSAHAPAWANNGKQIAFVVNVGWRPALAVTDASGSSARLFPLRDLNTNQVSWSPDDRWILYHQSYDLSGRQHSIEAVEIATGRHVTLGTHTEWLRGFWADDSRHVVVGIPATVARPRMTLLEADLMGGSSPLRELAGAPSQHNRLWPVDRTSVLVMRGEEQPITLEPYSGAGNTIQLLPPPRSFVAEPTVSGSREWLAFRRNPESDDNTRMSIVDVVRRDGSSRTTITLPFFAAGGQSLRFLPGDQQLVVVENPSATGDANVYLVTIATREARKLFVMQHWRSSDMFSPSPDGRTILYASKDAVPASYAALDVSRLLARKP